MRARLAAVALLVVLGVTACSGGEPEVDQAAPPQQQVAASQEATQPATAGPVPATLKFEGTTLDGKSFSGAALAGRPTVLWFWAPWCATCFGQAASVADMQTEFGTKVNLLGVAGLGDAKAMKEFVKDGEVGNVTHLNDEAGTVWKKFKIAEQSTFVLIDKDGKVLRTGWMDSVEFEGKVAEMAA
ncbi:redoxin domain-containing protein [Phytohabitans rumicis]|nr:redoxin domain-containing protein [Phytohabitans rumicis]